MTDQYKQNSGNPKRVFLVTGATGAIGKAIARQLAADLAHEVVLVGRDKAKTKLAAEAIIQAIGNDQVRFELADLSRQVEIQALANRWSGPLHVLINNAATTPRKRKESVEGIELQFATNVMGYFWMIQAFRDILIASALSRIVNVASYWAGDLDMDDLEFKRRRYNNNTAYRQSKQADRMLTSAFTEDLRSFNVTVNACHPGDVNSQLSNNLGFGGHESPDEGARTPVWLATDSIGREKTGVYFEHQQPVPDRFTQDREAVTALYQACLAYCR